MDSGGEVEMWSLKGKEQIFIGTNFGYKPGDIETLRKKLIKEIDVIDCTEKSKLKKWEIIEEVLEIIDKRFGVEEDG